MHGYGGIYRYYMLAIKVRNDTNAGTGCHIAQPGWSWRPCWLVMPILWIATNISFPTHVEKTIHEIEIYIGILIGAVTFSGSIIAFGKLSGKIGGSPLLLPARHWLNLGLLIADCLVWQRICLHCSRSRRWRGSFEPLVIMTIIALAYSVYIWSWPLVVLICRSWSRCLNSYSGWAASATGFML